MNREDKLITVFDRLGGTDQPFAKSCYDWLNEEFAEKDQWGMGLEAVLDIINSENSGLSHQDRLNEIEKLVNNLI